ncbi:unnamed protein product [Ophioblennius macclurei]
MRRFSSEGSLLDIDFLPWKKVVLQDAMSKTKCESGRYRPHTEAPTILEPGGGSSPSRSHQLLKEHSVSVEDLKELGKQNPHLLRVNAIHEGCRAYSDGQLVPDTQGSTESMEQDELDSTPLPSLKAQHRHHHRAKLSAAKLHLKSLFGQSPHSSHSNLAPANHKDSVMERRSRLLFMRQWSQMGHSKKKVSRDELDLWAKSLEDLLASQTGASVFEAFLRSEFSEENLQFYLACEQYKHSSNNFSLQRRAKDISATYIQPGAPREVNLDSKTRELTLQLLQAPSHSSLSHAQKRIYSLLDTDCYPRFLQSNVFLSLLAEAD